MDPTYTDITMRAMSTAADSVATYSSGMAGAVSYTQQQRDANAKDDDTVLSKTTWLTPSGL